ncbi:MAG: HIT family protein [Clostridia bacterium]|nr:HIT family protein [Clostridia bacterium]
MRTQDPNCAYCVHGEPLAKFGIYICDLTQTRLYLFKEQSHPGRVIVANKDHVRDITDLSDEERNAFFADVARVSRAIQKAFNPDRINYGAYNDKGIHLHFHLVPKYRNEFEFGGVFEMNPGRVTLSDAEYAEMIAKIKAAL